MATENRKQQFRFLAVGGANTALDFGLLFLLRSAGLPVISANIISTTVAFCFSFFANKKFTFKTVGTNLKREIILFIIVTLFGLWVLQTIVISGISALLADTTLSEPIILFIAKIIATIVTLIWNYLFYSRVVFKIKQDV